MNARSHDSAVYGENVVFIATLASYCLLYYDYILTFPNEVERFWRTAPKLTAVSILYIMNRVLALVGPIPVLVVIIHSDFTLTDKLCYRVQGYHQWVEILMQGVVAALLIMRIYALYNQRRVILVFYGVLLGVCGATSVWAIMRNAKVSRQGMEVSDALACAGGVMSAHQAKGLAYAWATMLLLDASVFVLTLTKALQARRVWHGALLGILLRDGTLYFGVLGIMNIINVILLLCAHPAMRGPMTLIVNALSSILVARLMLNLRSPKICGNYQPPTDLSEEPVVFGDSITDARDFGMSWLSTSVYGHDRPPDNTMQIELG